MGETEINWPELLRAADNASAVEQLRGLVLAALRVALRDRSDVSEAHLEDFTQESIVRILAQLDRFSGRSRFTTWAHAVAINTAFTELRRKRWQDVSLDSFTEGGRQLAEHPFAPAESTESSEEQTLLLDVLHRAIAEKLSERQRTAIVGELQGLPFDQVVALLGTNRNAAYKLVHDARKALKQHLAAAGISAETICSTFAP